MSENDAQWQHLPHDPVRFFGLGSGFDRKDLKRSYAGLIRRYKPERAPEEFQRIRAAYEALDDRLRHGRDVDEPATFEADALAEERTTPSPSPALDAAKRVRSEGPEALREALEGEAPEDTRTWCALALLDSALEDDPMAPFRRLLDGLDRAREPVVLAQLLEQLARNELEPRAAKAFIELMTAAAQGGRGSAVRLSASFWYLTESHWLTLARRAEIQSFQRFLDRTRTRLAGVGGVGEHIVLTRLFRRLCLRADEAWLGGIAQDIQEDLTDAPPWIEYEFDLADRLARYRYVRDAFCNGDELRELMDEAVVAIIEGDEVEADSAFLRAQVECGERSEELLETLPVHRDGSPGALSAEVPLQILGWYGEEWRERWAPALAGDGESAQSLRAREFARRLDRRTERSLVGRLSFVTFLVAIAAVTAAGIGIGALVKPWLGEGGNIVSLVLVGLFWGSLFTGRLWRPVIWLSRPFAWRNHRHLWRPMIANFLAEQHMSAEDLLRVFEEKSSPTGFHESFYLASDQGLHALGEALRVAEH